MQIILQDSGVSETNSKYVLEAAQALGIETHCVGIVPFSHEITGLEGFDPSKPSFWYGSTALLDEAKKKYDSPYLFINEQFDTSYHHMRNDFLNDKKYVTSVQIKMLNADRPFRAGLKTLIMEDKRPRFVRPVSSMKTFPGTVLTTKNFEEALSTSWFCSALESHGDELAVISPYQEIWAEWRFFVVDGQAISGSLYKESGRLEMRPASQDMLTIAQAYCEKWLPMPTCVMDLALTTEGIKVVEYNSINSSGGYSADWKKILKALEEVII